jgi:alkylation response protein AidB-like acyl-CoA dehydrogenase
MQFDFDEEQQEICETIRRFTAQEIVPRATDWDEQGSFPRETLAQLAELGLWGMTIPEEYGGIALSRLTTALVYEQLAMGDMGLAVGLSVHNMVAGILARMGNAQQQQRWLPEMASGAVFGAFSLSEPEAGSDAASLQCRVERSGDGYEINGTKLWVTSGGEAELYVVMARNGRDGQSSGTRGISSFVVEKGTPGFSFGKVERKMGLHSSPTRELVFEHCRVPGENRIGEEGQGFRIALGALNGGRVNIGAIAVGVAQAALETARDYARERKQFGHVIGSYQGIQFMLADMAMKIEAARLMVYQAAYKMDTGQNANMYASMAKCFATDVAMEVATNAVQILGGAGYVRDYPVERYMRDVKVAQIFEGTNQIQRIVIARALLGDIGRDA